MALSAVVDKYMGDLVLGVLRTPELAASLSDSDWDTVLRLLRHQGLLARLHAGLLQRGLLGALPDKVQDHLLASSVIAGDHLRMILWEVDRIRYALRQNDIPIVLLKGAAYVVAGLPVAQGRLVSDVDILVPESDLSTVEAALLDAGWESVKSNEYDQHYYRQWMHEIPPLRHTLRHTDVDVHHAILPRTARIKPDSRRLLAASEVIDGELRVFCAADMVLHSAAHLFYDGDLDHGLRDLLDLHDLLHHFSGEPGFWDKLKSRAHELELQRPLFYALRYCHKYMQTTIPEDMLSAVAEGAPNRGLTGLMDWLVHSALYPGYLGYPPLSTVVRRWLLYIRSHYIRMPLQLLIPHLTRKAFRSRHAANQ